MTKMKGWKLDHVLEATWGGLHIFHDADGSVRYTASSYKMRRGKWIQHKSIRSDQLKDVSPVLKNCYFAVLIEGAGIAHRKGVQSVLSGQNDEELRKKYIIQIHTSEAEDEISICRVGFLESIIQELNSQGLFPSSIYINAGRFKEDTTTGDSQDLTLQLAAGLKRKEAGIIRTAQVNRQSRMATTKRIARLGFPTVAIILLLSGLITNAIRKDLEKENSYLITRIRHEEQSFDKVRADNAMHKDQNPLSARIREVISVLPELRLKRFAIHPPDEQKIKRNQVQIQEKAWLLEGYCVDIKSLVALNKCISEVKWVKKVRFGKLESSPHGDLEFQLVFEE